MEISGSMSSTTWGEKGERGLLSETSGSGVPPEGLMADDGSVMAKLEAVRAGEVQPDLEPDSMSSMLVVMPNGTRALHQ